jgi:hypothetical protein
VKPVNTDIEDLLILPDEELHGMYKHAKKIRRFLAFSMLVTGLFLGIALVDFVIVGITGGHFSDSSADLAFVFSMIAAFVCTSAVLFDDPRRQAITASVTLIIQALLFPALLIMGTDKGTHDQVLEYIRKAGIHYGADQLTTEALMLVLSGAVNFFAYKQIKIIAGLKAHPRFPFTNSQRDEKFLDRASREEVLRYMDNTSEGSAVQTVSGEELLDADSKAPAPEAPEPAELLQQRTQVWKKHDKADTAYTMDNLRNMHFDPPDEGELSGSDLEQELMKATAPKKKPEPLPEEFFQQTPVVWRKRKDGTTYMERREAPSVPAGEHDSRSVLP